MDIPTDLASDVDDHKSNYGGATMPIPDRNTVDVGTPYYGGMQTHVETLPVSSSVIYWSRWRRARLFATGPLMIAPAVFLWWNVTAQFSLASALPSLLIPQVFLLTAVLPVWGCARMMMALSRGRRFLALDDEGCTVKLGSRKTRIHWADVISISPVEAVRRKRTVLSGSTGFGASGAYVADPRSYDPSIATEKTGRNAGVELRLRPGCFEGRESYWIADQFEQPREAVAALMGRYRQAFQPKRTLQPQEIPVRGMSEVNDYARYMVVYAFFGVVLWLCVLGACVAVYSNWSNRHSSPPERSNVSVMNGAATSEKAPVRLYPAMPSQPPPSSNVR